MCCSRLAANTRRKKIAIWAPSHNFVGLYLCNYGTYRQSEKNLLSSNISSRCPRNMVNFGLLAAEIVSLVWDTPANFNGFRVLAALLHGTLVVGVSQTAALNRGRHLYLAGRPSGWALAHISSCSIVYRHLSVVSVSWQGDCSEPRGHTVQDCLHQSIQHKSSCVDAYLPGHGRQVCYVRSFSQYFIIQ